MDARDGRLLEHYSSLEYLILLGDFARCTRVSVPMPRMSPLADRHGLMRCSKRSLASSIWKTPTATCSRRSSRHPSWSSQVDRLHRDHDLLFAKLGELRGRVECDTWIAPIANEVRRDICEWTLKLIAHRRSETRLVQTAMNLEVGIGD